MTGSWSAEELRTRLAEDGTDYLEFLRVGSMSGGLYALAAGDVDTQTPHSEDEVYVVLAGSAAFVCAGTQREVTPGDTLFVAAGVEHRFVDITEDLEVLVFFAPAEGTHSTT